MNEKKSSWKFESYIRATIAQNEVFNNLELKSVKHDGDNSATVQILNTESKESRQKKFEIGDVTSLMRWLYQITKNGKEY